MGGLAPKLEREVPKTGFDGTQLRTPGEREIAAGIRGTSKSPVGQIAFLRFTESPGVLPSNT